MEASSDTWGKTGMLLYDWGIPALAEVIPINEFFGHPDPPPAKLQEILEEAPPGIGLFLSDLGE